MILLLLFWLLLLYTRVINRFYCYADYSRYFLVKTGTTNAPNCISQTFPRFFTRKKRSLLVGFRPKSNYSHVFDYHSIRNNNNRIVGFYQETLVWIIYSYNMLSEHVEMVVRIQQVEIWSDGTMVCVCVCVWQKGKHEKIYGIIIN